MGFWYLVFTYAWLMIPVGLAVIMFLALRDEARAKKKR
jgi:hypothetical protein